MQTVARTRIAGIGEYYQQIIEVDIAEVARELLDGRVVQESDRLLQCDCPHHASDSRRSLHVFPDKQGWYCFGCGVGGDVLQFVEFVQSGDVTRGRSGPMPDSHRRARDYLAERAGLPPLSKHGLTPEQLAEAEASRSEELRIQGVLTALASLYHDRLRAAPDVVEWFRGQYGISSETIEQLKIGYASNEGIVRALISTSDGFTPRELAASGAFRPTAQDGLAPFFESRIIFPYWSRGRVAFLIGRKTPWTPEHPSEEGKYRKLPVHNERDHSHIAPCITNSHLFNEDVLLTRPDRLVITEGVTDCISLMEHGLPAVSPATVRIREADWSRILPKLSGVKTVFIAQDNEPSGVGLTGALATARTLRGQGINTRIVILPLDPQHGEARAALHEGFGIEPGIDQRDLKSRLDRLAATDRDEAARLLAQAKIDVNAFFAAGHTTEEFEALLSSSKTPVELAVESIPADAKPEDRDRLLKPVLEEIATLDSLERGRHLKTIHARFGKATIPLADLRDQIRALQKKHRTEARKEKHRAKRTPDSPEGTCRAAIEEALISSEQNSGHPDFAQAAEAAYTWFASHGARFFRTGAGDPFMFLDDEILWMDSSDRARRRTYLGSVYSHTGLAPTTTGGRTFFDVLASLASKRGEVRDHFSWLHTNVSSRAVYFNLNNASQEIAMVTPTGSEIARNGANTDSVILAGSQKMSPLRYLPDADAAEADRLIKALIYDNLACSPGDRFLIIYWLSCLLLIDFAGTRPMMRFEGPSGSGKTTAAKIVSTLIYGSPQQKKSTDAANYSDGARNPLIVLDNIEVKQMTDELTSFMLTCVTGISKEKRKGGSDTETVIERPRCLLNTTGIEPLGGELSEILSRSFVIRFDLTHSASDCFLESEILAQIQTHRDLIFSVVIKRTSRVLALIQSGARERVMRLLNHALGDHSKRRANDYLALMYLMMLVAEVPEGIEPWLDTLHPTFVAQLESQDDVASETARESNPIATSLSALFNAYRDAQENDRQCTASNVVKTNLATFRERFQVKFTEPWRIEGLRARDLFIALKRVAKEYNLAFPMTSVQQFAQRLANDLETIRRAGFHVSVTTLRGNLRTYDIAQAR